MIHKLNIHNSRMAILTHKSGGINIINATMIFPSNIKIEVGDAIASPIFFKQIEDKALLLKVIEIIEERPSAGDWKTDRPTWRRVVFEKTMYSKLELGSTVRVIEEKENNKMVEKFYLN